jgi:hypothetical protein
MATVILPTRTDGTQRYNFRCNLGGSLFGIEMVWNSRESAWWMLLSDSSDNLLCTRKVVVGCALLWRFQSNLALPAGEMWAVDTSGQSLDPTLTDLGSRVLLTFQNLADFRP